MTARQIELVNIYKQSQQNIFDTIIKKVAKGSPASFQRAMLKEVNAEIAWLQKRSVAWVESQIPKQYTETIMKAEDNLQEWFDYADKNNIPKYKYSHADITTLNKKAIKALIETTAGNISVANMGLQKSIQSVLTQKIASGETIKQTKDRIVEAIYGTNGDGKIIINGRKYDPTKYAETVARSSTAEATNTAAMTEGKAVGSTIIEMTSHFPTCPICAPLQGRWYSTDPSDTDYPYIYNTAWRNGRHTVHPNCEHRFNTVILELEDNETIEEMKKLSNRPIDGSDQTQKQLDRYYKDQNKKAKRWSDKQQYDRYKSRLGEENVPKSFSGFRSMKKSGNDNWNDLHKNYVSTGSKQRKESGT